MGAQMPTMDQLALSMRLATVVVPVAVYFLILGVLNSRPRPQLLSGRHDFALLLGALSPLLILPAASFFGIGATAIIVVAAIAAAWTLSRTRTTRWVIYNIQIEQARSAVADALRSMGFDGAAVNGGFSLPGKAFVEIGAFPLLRNVSVRMHGGDKALAGRFAGELWRALSAMEAPTSPMAVSLLLVATAMMVAPLALAAQRVPELVRILTDLMH